MTIWPLLRFLRDQQLLLADIELRNARIDRQLAAMIKKFEALK